MPADASNLPGSSPSPLAAGTRVAASVTGAIRKAAQATGTSFDYLLTTAKVESSLNPNSTARNSSATGLFQFIEQTWLSTLRQAGKALGYGQYADAIGQTTSGRYVVKDPSLRSQVMALRKDPTAAAAMGGAFTQQNSAALSRRIGRKPSDAELYIAHFFGAGAAAKVINLTGNDPQANAAALFPAAAQANRPIFYDKAGTARSVAGVYAELTRRYQAARATPTPGSALATAANEALATPRLAMPVPDTTAITTAYVAVQPAASKAVPGEIAATAAPIFHSLFHSDERRGAVAPIVTQFWGVGAERAGAGEAASVPAPKPVAPRTPAASAPIAPPAPAGGPGMPLDLFQELRPNVRALFDGSV
jgi:Transglycosylase SLT domain